MAKKLFTKQTETRRVGPARQTTASKRLRKPRELPTANQIYPRIDVTENGEVTMQTTATGRVQKVPLNQARYLFDRLGRTILYAQQQRKS